MDLDVLVKEYKKSKNVKKLAEKYGVSYQIMYHKLYRRGAIEKKNIEKIRPLGNKSYLYIPKTFLLDSQLYGNLTAKFIPKKKKLVVELFERTK